jgi:hypothetical protein
LPAPEAKQLHAGLHMFLHLHPDLDHSDRRSLLALLRKDRQHGHIRYRNGKTSDHPRFFADDPHDT